jgi:outer membrane cobalamin receptor
MKKLSLSFLVFFCAICFSYGQHTSISIKGYVKDKVTKEPLIGATVYEKDLQKGTSTDFEGYFSLTLTADIIQLEIAYLGYESQLVSFSEENHTLEILLQEISNELEEVVVTSDPYQEKLQSTQMSVETISTQEAKTIPAMFGEVDLIKVMQLKPGVQSGGEGSSGLYVRGGGPDQNLFLLDGGTIYNASHLFGLFSTFNSDAVKDVQLYKGGFPARFGGRLSSVIEVNQRTGNTEKFSGSGGLGIISSRLSLEGPIQKGKSSFIISGRRTYFDLFTGYINEAQQNNPNFTPIPDYYFYDLNAKFHFKFGSKDEINITAYQGHDNFGFNDGRFNFDFSWGNRLASVHWKHQINPDFIVNTQVGTTSYGYHITNQLDAIRFNLNSGIHDYYTRIDFENYEVNNHHIQFGIHATHHRFKLGRTSINTEDKGVDFTSGNDYNAFETGLYFSDEFDITPRWSINAGTRWSSFFNQSDFFHGFEPRLATNYKLGPKTSLKAGYSKMYQYIHLASNSGATLPTDFWYPSQENIRPQESQQVASGISTILGKGKFMLTNEVYYKWMNNQIDFKDGAQLFVHPQLNHEFVFGKGYSYGNEIFLEKKKGNTTGWIGYTLSWTYHQFDELNGGRRFHPRHDRRHDFSIVLNQKINQKLILTANWVYGTGNAITLPIGRFYLWNTEGSSPMVVPDFQTRNNYRLPAYHRLDLGLIYKMTHKWGQSDLSLSLYNVYNRRNPYFIYFQENKAPNANQRFSARQVSLFPIIPSLTYNFNF